MKFIDLARELRDAGFTEVRCRGTHYCFEHPTYGRITVCRGHGNRDLTPGPVANVRKHIELARSGRSKEPHRPSRARNPA